MSNHWHPNGAGVLLETVDGTLDLSDITWQEVAPCGCVCGLTTAATTDLIITAQQAGRQFASSEPEYQKYLKLGFTWRPREHHLACDDAALKCPHDPLWGYEKPPTPEGFQWATVRALGSRSKLTHLVPVEAIERRKAHDYSILNVEPLCGGRPSYHWSDEWYATDGKVECARCAAKASATPPEVQR